MASIGFIGLGIMGMPMARHLQDAGHTVITSKSSAPRIRSSSSTALNSSRRRKRLPRR